MRFASTPAPRFCRKEGRVGVLLTQPQPLHRQMVPPMITYGVGIRVRARLPHTHRSRKVLSFRLVLLSQPPPLCLTTLASPATSTRRPARAAVPTYCGGGRRHRRAACTNCAATGSFFVCSPYDNFCKPQHWSAASLCAPVRCSWCTLAALGGVFASGLGPWLQWRLAGQLSMSMGGAGKERALRSYHAAAIT